MSTIVLNTPVQIACFRLASLKYQLRMEAIGLKSSGGAIRPRICKEFGLRPRAPHAEYIAACERKIEELRQPPTAINEAGNEVYL